jgi:hypothetical protein
MQTKCGSTNTRSGAKCQNPTSSATAGTCCRLAHHCEKNKEKSIPKKKKKKNSNTKCGSTNTRSGAKCQNPTSHATPGTCCRLAHHCEKNKEKIIPTQKPQEKKDNEIEVESSTSPGVIYRVNVLLNTCTCPSWKYQRLPTNLRDCKHLVQIRGKKVSDKIVQAIEYPSPKSEETVPFQIISSSIPKLDSEKLKRFYWSIKYDGIRVALTKDGGRTRNGVHVLLLPPPDIMVIPDDVTYDTELIYDEHDGKKTNSVLVWKLLNEGKTEHLVYRIFDLIPSDHSRPLEETHESRGQFLKRTVPASLLVTQHDCVDWKTVRTLLGDILSQGGEGMVVRDRFGPYLMKSAKNTNAFKLKADFHRKMKGQ